MTLRHWVPISIASGIALSIYAGLLWRLEDRIYQHDDEVRVEIINLRAEVGSETQALRGELVRGLYDCESKASGKEVRRAHGAD